MRGHCGRQGGSIPARGCAPSPAQRCWTARLRGLLSQLSKIVGGPKTGADEGRLSALQLKKVLLLVEAYSVESESVEER